MCTETSEVRKAVEVRPLFRLSSRGWVSAVTPLLVAITVVSPMAVAASTAGTSASPTPDAVVLPNSMPSAPTGVTGAPGDASVQVTWVAPGDDGGSPITGYTATASPAGTTCATSGALSCTVIGLTNGTAYTFTVTATNGDGTGLASSPSAVVTPTAPVPPTASITALPNWIAATSIPLSWAAVAGSSPIASYDVRYRRAAWSGNFGSVVIWRSATTATSAAFPASSGYTYCFSVLARDTLGAPSSWAPETCTATPVDDRGLTRSSGWTTGTSASYYRSTYTRSSKYATILTRTGIVAKRIAIVATTCPTCGFAMVSWGSSLLKLINFYSPTTVTKQLITVATFSSARSGTLTIKLASSGKNVYIDGVAIRRN